MSVTVAACPRECGGTLLRDDVGEITGCESGCSMLLIRGAMNGAVGTSHPVLASRDDERAPLSEVLNEVAGFIRRFVVVSCPQADVAALWVAHTHTFAASSATAYLAITSAEKRSGKTRLLEVLKLLVARPWLTGRVTPAVLARKVDAERPSLLLDESDAAFKGDKDYAEALRGLLNSGHRLGGKTTVCVGQGAEISYRDFSTFCPKAIAGIGRLPDTVADRSIPIRLERKARTEEAERFHRRDADIDARPLRDQLELLETQVERLEVARPDLPDALDDRAQDTAEPLLAIADLAGGDWPARARAALVELHGGRAVEDDSIGVRLLADARAVFGGGDRLGTADLLKGLHELDEAPWGDWYGKPLSSRSLAKMLRPYAIAPHSDGTTRGYRREAFEDAWARYLPPDPSTRQEAASLSGKPAISTRQSDEPTDTSKSAAIPHHEREPDALTDTPPETPAEELLATPEQEAEFQRLAAKYGGEA